MDSGMSKAIAASCRVC